MATSSDLGEGSDLGGGGSSRHLGSYQAFTPDGGGITTIEDGVRSEDSTEYTLGVIPDFEVDGGAASGSLTPDAEPKNLHVKAGDTKEKVAQGPSPRQQQPPKRHSMDSMDDTEPSSLLTMIVPDDNDEQPSLLGLGAEVYVPNGGGGGGHSQHDSVSSASGTVTGSSSGSISGASVSTIVYRDQNVSTNTAVHAGGDAFGEEEPTSALRQQQQHVANTSMGDSEHTKEYVPGEHLDVNPSDTKEKVAQGSSPRPPSRSPIGSMDAAQPSLLTIISNRTSADGSSPRQQQSPSRSPTSMDAAEPSLLTIIPSSSVDVVPDDHDEQPSFLGHGLPADVLRRWSHVPGLPHWNGADPQQDSVSTALGPGVSTSTAVFAGDQGDSISAYRDQSASTSTAVFMNSVGGGPPGWRGQRESISGNSESISMYRDQNASTSTAVFAGAGARSQFAMQNESTSTAVFAGASPRPQFAESTSTAVFAGASPRPQFAMLELDLNSSSSSSHRTDPESPLIVPEYSLRDLLSKTATDFHSAGGRSAMNNKHKRKSLSWSQEHEFFTPVTTPRAAEADDLTPRAKDRSARRLLCESPQQQLDLNHFIFEVESVGTSDVSSVTPVVVVQKPPPPVNRKPRGRYYKGGGQSKKVQEGTGLLDKPKPDGQGCPKCSVM